MTQTDPVDSAPSRTPLLHRAQDNVIRLRGMQAEAYQRGDFRTAGRALVLKRWWTGQVQRLLGREASE